jgi:hypothetical protein
MTAEEYFDSIYTYHANDYVRMPLNELYELMEGYLKAHNEALNIADVVDSCRCPRCGEDHHECLKDKMCYVCDNVTQGN